MRTPLYDPNARRKTVSVTLNEDLAAKATAAGINISRTAETALAKALEEAEAARIRLDVQEAVRITDDLVRQYGHPLPDAPVLFFPEGDEDHAA
jgi:post-segregation antitoxin (ccd killing protein)